MISLIRQDNFSKTLWLAGTSSDTKPTDVFNYKGAILPVTNGSAYLEVDTSTYYVFDAENGEWVEQSSGGGGGIEPEGSIEITANGTYNVKRKAQAVVNVPNDVASFIEATPAVLNNDDVKAVKDYAFYCADNLKSVNFKNAAHIGKYSFQLCLDLVSASFTECTEIDFCAFISCSELEIVSAPKCKVIRNSAFSACINLVSFPFESVESLGQGAFGGCRSLTDVKFEKLLGTVGAGAFNGCSALISADLGGAGRLENSVFSGDTLFNTLILRKTDAICTLAHVSAFQSTAIQAGNGFIYTPRNLIDTYKTATNWSIYAAYFRALEDYTVDGTTTGDLDPSKI